jgi:alpha-glucosidase
MANPWWETAVIYQIYPRSFQDSDGDGIGDLDGIRRRLDYLVWLGVDAVWISPIFPSPMLDFGYDVADYCGIDPLFGTLDRFDALVADARARGLKVILDLVPNHTASSHPWFIASRASRTDPKRSWYIWRDPAPDGGPPNNWLSHFGGSAWTFDPATRQYYYHAYLAEQPDLDWRNPDVRAAIHDVMRFWFRRGVDGFRIDVIWHLVKDARFRDNPQNPAWTPKDPEIERLLAVHSTDRPEVHDVIAELRRVADEFEDRLLIGEIYLPVDRLVTYYGKSRDGVHLPFNFALLATPWTAAAVAEAVLRYEAALPPGGWPNWVLGNHDRPRVAARFGEASARAAAMLLTTLRGTPTFYYGDELGIGHVEIPEASVQDPWGKREPGIGVGRDPSRTPMQWDASPFAGFSIHTPWLPLTEDHRTRNVASMRERPASMLRLVRSLFSVRRTRRSLSQGTWRLLALRDEVLAYAREDDDEQTIVVVNFGATSASWAPRPGMDPCTVLLSTDCDRAGEEIGSTLELRPNEGVILACDPASRSAQ